ncbi:binding-protein-dependent transport systems inner membrane component [Thermobaculum terrenum ATCC BAA-798]|uniref:Binding-protein-dependent transport systems inner membrane component n=1 Tax=Thermobaculum terrenum (strain ATCC BAA-798 / CCMEE 7001 / YNP1) TaxID=525904 RepID=D1CI91_THET1|nr:sugar ABC transporter permease [Thermobaculum terrenum]ACZ43462.1 binding-protein-dependent transport systems inner membrane component [Thermobaculum terrenum ATCC BAA-798]
MRTISATKEAARERRAHRRVLGRKAVAGYLFIAPSIAFLLVFALIPFLFTIYVSLHDWNMLVPLSRARFLGFENYRYLLFEDPLFWQTFRNSVVFALGNVVLTMALSLAVALLLNSRLRLRALWRSAFFMPYVTSSVAIAIVWSNLYHPTYGLFNGVLQFLGLPTLDFTNSPSQAMPSLIATSIWHELGYYMIIFLAGLQSIPGEVYDAAKVDGAGSWQQFWRITLPLLRPTILFVAVIITLSSLQVFDLPFILTNGGPVNSTNTLVLYMYQTAFQFLRMGRATAMAILLFVVVFAMTLIQLRLLRERE